MRKNIITITPIAELVTKIISAINIILSPYWFYLTAGFFFALFWFFGARTIDPDLGLHLRMGQYILQSGIPKTDPLSYTMSSFPYVDHTWLQDIILYWLNKYLGHVFTAGIYALLAICALIIQYFRNKERRYLTIFILAAATLSAFIGVRTQVMTLLFFSVLLALVFEENLWKKYRLIIPLIMLVWANLHGGFAIGMFTLYTVIIIKSIQQHRINRADLLVGVFSFIATLINPYGLRLWGEIWLQMSDSQLRWAITEWLPAVFNVNFPFSFYVVLATMLVFRYRKKLKLPLLFVFIILTLAAISSVRHIPLWVLISLEITGLALTFLRLEAHDDRRFFRAYTVLATIIILLTAYQSFSTIRQVIYYRINPIYPVKAITYLKRHPVSGNVYSTYNWGGFLDWQLPEKKVFVDGRMPSWRWSAHIKGESDYVFNDFKAINSGSLAILRIIHTYNISTFLLPVSKPVREKWLDRLIKKLFPAPQYPDIETQLKQLRWLKVYNDSTSVIYQKP
jgi:hypothetical protein